jgi:predicted dinucleotide-binding enzyme
VAGDDAEAKRTATQLARASASSPAMSGLRMARALEEMAFLHIAMKAMNNWVWQSAVTLVGPTKP